MAMKYFHNSCIYLCVMRVKSLREKGGDWPKSRKVIMTEFSGKRPANKRNQSTVIKRFADDKGVKLAIRDDGKAKKDDKHF